MVLSGIVPIAFGVWALLKRAWYAIANWEGEFMHDNLRNDQQAPYEKRIKNFFETSYPSKAHVL